MQIRYPHDINITVRESLPNPYINFNEKIAIKLRTYPDTEKSGYGEIRLRRNRDTNILTGPYMYSTCLRDGSKFIRTPDRVLEQGGRGLLFIYLLPKNSDTVKRCIAAYTPVPVPRSMFDYFGLIKPSRAPR